MNPLQIEFCKHEGGREVCFSDNRLYQRHTACFILGIILFIEYEPLRVRVYRNISLLPYCTFLEVSLSYGHLFAKTTEFETSSALTRGIVLHRKFNCKYEGCICAISSMSKSQCMSISFEVTFSEHNLLKTVALIINRRSG